MNNLVIPLCQQWVFDKIREHPAVFHLRYPKQSRPVRTHIASLLGDHRGKFIELVGIDGCVVVLRTRRCEFLIVHAIGIHRIEEILKIIEPNDRYFIRNATALRHRDTTDN